ncbi:MAG: uncharacterized protein JWP97_1700 [Labilithrix sp.]|nr:uncharacterized protein [Labilithrix sp.]
MTTPSSLDPTRSERDELVLGLPLHRQLGLAFDGRGPEGTVTHFVVTGELAAFGFVHGGTLYALLDVTSFLALAPLLGEGEHAVTHDLHVSVMRPAPVGATIHLTARVVRRGKQIAFLEARAEWDGTLVATARVTKTIVTRT